MNLTTCPNCNTIHNDPEMDRETAKLIYVVFAASMVMGFLIGWMVFS